MEFFLALPLKPLAPAPSAFEPRFAGLLKVPELMVKAAYISPLPFMAAFEVFNDTRAGLWGEGKTLGAIWRHDLPFESKLRGLAVGVDGRGYFLDDPAQWGAAWLGELSATGVVVSSVPVGWGTQDLAAGR
ncbi:MAG: hypothetical protein FD126_3015, partial [Elusimicrobia bacterium]